MKRQNLFAKARLQNKTITIIMLKEALQYIPQGLKELKIT